MFLTVLFLNRDFIMFIVGWLVIGYAIALITVKPYSRLKRSFEIPFITLVWPFYLIKRLFG